MAASVCMGSRAISRRGLPWLIVCAATFSLAAGYFGPYSPWVLLHKIPLFSSERIPPRFLIFFTLGAGVLAGLGVDALRRSAGVWNTVAAILVGIALVDGWFVSPSYLHDVVAGGQDLQPWSPTFKQWSEPDASHAMYMVSNANGGTIACNDAIPLKSKVRGFEDPNYRGEQYLLGLGSVALTRWTPDALRLRRQCAFAHRVGGRIKTTMRTGK